MRKLSVALSLAIALCASACSSVQKPVGRPPIAIPAKVREPLITGKKFRVAALDFESPGTDKDQLSASLPAMLLTELANYGRFAVFEAGNLRRGRQEEILSEQSAKDHVDGYLSGTITNRRVGSDGRGRVCVDVRLSNAQNHEILVAEQACSEASFSANGTRWVERRALVSLAETISSKIPDPGGLQVLAAEGKLVTINQGCVAPGHPQCLLRGMVAYLEASGGRSEKDSFRAEVEALTGARRDAQDPWTLNPQIVGEMYVVSVEADHAIAVLYRGDYAVPGDTVHFK